MVDFKKELANFIFASKYARYNEKLGRRELWEETVDRVRNMHLKKFRNLSEEHQKEIRWAFDMVKEKKVVPSMRSLQFGGKAIEVNNTRMFNCSVTHIHSLRSFSEIFYLLLCGCGVGFGVSKHFLNRLPNLVDASNKTGTILTYVVDDTIEGWADSVEALLACYFQNTPYTGRKIIFDYSRIRHKGTPLKVGGGKAPGYKPLKNAHAKIKTLLDHIIEDLGQSRLKSINAYDIIMHTSDAVLSGGIRRSATICVFDKDDEDMMNAKTYFNVDKIMHFGYDEETKLWYGKVKVNNKTYEVELSDWDYNNLKTNKKISWFYIEPQRGRSNNSVLLMRDEISYEEFQSIIQKTKEFGEPGFVFSNHKHQLFNPCFTGDTKIDTPSGQFAIQDLVGKELPVYCYDGKKINISKMKNIRKTGKKQEVWKLTLDNGEIIKSTPNHRFMLRDGSYLELKDLQVGDSLMPFRRSKRNSKGYNNLSLNNGTYIGEATFVAEWKYGRKVKSNECVHHINKNKQDNSPENLEIISFSKHSSEHMMGDNNPSRKYPERMWTKVNPKLVLREKNPRWNHKIKIEDVAKLKSTGLTINQIAKKLKTTYMIVKKRLFYAKLDNHKVANIEFYGYEDVYDGEVEKYHNFALASGVIVHNCAEISFIPVTPDGVCGIQFCNLSSINGAKILQEEDFYLACKAATIIGTLQATYTNFNYFQPVSKQLTEEEALLGVSITGMMDNPSILLNGKIQKEGAKICKEVNEEWSKILKVNPAARITCVKPEGTSSLVLESASGIHPHHAKRYFRRVQMNKVEPIMKFFKKYNPHMVEDSVWSVNKTDEVVSFPIQVSDQAIVKKDLTAIKHLEYIKSTQQNWVVNGTTKYNQKPINHNVSCTVLVKENEWDEVCKYLYKNKDYFSAVSLIPASGDKIYKQAPMEEITSEEDEIKFKTIVDNYKEVNYKELKEEEDNTNLAKEIACAGGACEVV